MTPRARSSVLVLALFAIAVTATCTGGEPGTAGTAREMDRSLNSVTYQVRTTRPGWLVVTDSWDDGWRATVDGRDADVLPANYALRAVRIPAGEHTVSMRYNPAHFRISAASSLATLALLITGLVAALVRGRRRAQ